MRLQVAYSSSYITTIWLCAQIIDMATKNMKAFCLRKNAWKVKWQQNLKITSLVFDDCVSLQSSTLAFLTNWEKMETKIYKSHLSKGTSYLKLNRTQKRHQRQAKFFTPLLCCEALVVSEGENNHTAVSKKRSQSQ